MNSSQLKELFDSCEQFVCPVSGVKIPLSDKEKIAAHKEKLIAYFIEQEKQAAVKAEIASYRSQLLKCQSLTELNEAVSAAVFSKFGAPCYLNFIAVKIYVSARVGVVDKTNCYLSYDEEVFSALNVEVRKFLMALIGIVQLKTDAEVGGRYPYTKPFFVFKAQDSSLFQKIATWQHSRITAVELRAFQQARLSQDVTYIALKERYKQSCEQLNGVRQAHAQIEQQYQEYRRSICESLDKELNSIKLDV